MEVTVVTLLFIALAASTLGVLEVLDVTEGEAPFDNDDVGDAVTVILLVAVLENEDVKDELDVIVPVALIVADGVREDEDVIDIVTLSD